MASSSVRKSLPQSSAKDKETSGKTRKGQTSRKGRQSTQGRTSRLGGQQVDSEEQEGTDQARLCEDAGATGSSESFQPPSATSKVAMEDQAAATGKKMMAPPFGMPPGMPPRMADMMKMMGNEMPEDLKKIMGNMDMKNFSFNSFVEHLCMAAWHADDDSSDQKQHIPEGSHSRRLLMALARGDSEGEAAAENLSLSDGGGFKKPFGINTKAMRGKTLVKQDNTTVEPARTTRSRGPQVSEKPALLDLSEAPSGRSMRGVPRASKRAAEDDMAAGAAAAAAADAPEESVAIPKKRRILVSLIKGDLKSTDSLGQPDAGGATPEEKAGGSEKEADNSASASDPSPRLKKNAKNFIGKEIGFASASSPTDEGKAGQVEAEDSSDPATSSTDPKPHASGSDSKNECAVCGDQFDTKYYVKNHMKIHSGERPFACKECSKTFSHKASLKAHMDIHSREVQNFFCELCDRKFEYAYLLERHNKSHERHQCKACGKCMCNAQALTSHMRSDHSTKFHYDCEVCGKSYSRFSAFVAHQQTHADNPAAGENMEFEDGLGGKESSMGVAPQPTRGTNTDAAGYPHDDKSDQ